MTLGVDESIDRVAVIGAGTMGAGISQIISQARITVTMIGLAADDVARGMAGIERTWARSIENGRLTPAEVDGARSRLTTATELDALDQADLLVEAVFEQEEVKREVLTSVAARLKPNAILASNTSSLSITRLASFVPHAERFLGLHFFNPVPIMALVEVVLGLRTSPETAARGIAFVERIGKTPVTVNDSPGFVSNRLLLPMINEAVFCLAEGVAERDAIDQVMQLGMAHPMGPLALADLIGLDVCLNIMEVLHRDLGEDKYRPAPLLRQMVAAGKLGKKSGEGFYRYP